MNKSKIVLLTILIVLVLYCGAVIFVTKPNTNAYEGLFGSKDNSTPAAAVPVAETTQADIQAEIQAAIQAEHDAVMAQTEKIAADKAEAAQKSASDYADAAIAEAIAKLEIPQAVETTVEKIVEGDTIIQREEFDLEAHLPEIVDAVYDQLIEDKDAILDMIVDELLARLDSAEASADSSSAAVPADYDTTRRQIREDEIRKMLEQLQD